MRFAGLTVGALILLCVPGIPLAAFAHTEPIAIAGLVKRSLQITDEDLKRLPAIESRVTFQTDHGEQTATYKGALLWAVIDQAGVDDPGKWGELRHVLSVIAADGYRLMISVGEIDPNFGNAPRSWLTKRTANR